MGNLQSNPSSSTQTIEKKYEVFLNFRGKDTRYGFTNHLYEALRAKLIETFMDEEGIEKGEEIGPKLIKTIRDSMIWVVIFSKEYASSKWCLRELVEIMECAKKNEQTVIPVFYKVEVHHVRHQEGSFKDGFDQLVETFEKDLKKEQVDSAAVEKRKIEFYEETQKWRQALEVGSRVKGWHVEGPESEVIDKIVKDIWEKLMRTYKLSPCDFKGQLFGIEERLKQVMSLLYLGNTDTRIIGIWGMGGIGKTTIADAIFHQISEGEYCKCFIQNVRQRLEQCGGLVNVQQEVLSKVLNNQDIKLDGVTLSKHIKRRLHGAKVFIVLDDVDDFSKLEKLAAGLDGLGSGSRIIITTRRKDILKMCGVNDDYIYEIKGLSNQEARKLFCQYAFSQSTPIEELMALSHETLQAINGNPLGLKVAGSSLLGLNKLEWQSALNGITKNPEILDVLQISFNRLAPEHRDTFLDIACFFVGKHEEYVVKILDNCPYSLKVLSNRSLITISIDKIIQMHDLLQEMGREIVCKENLKNPGKRSRLWIQEDILDTLKNVSGTDEIRGIFLNMSQINEEHLRSHAFEKMTNLKFLKFYDSTFYEYRFSRSKLYCFNLSFSNGISYLSNKLRYLHWLGYPLKVLPSNFNPKYLVELNLRHSNIEKLWEKNTCTPKLKRITLKHCPYLIQVLDHLYAPELQNISIRHCESLLGLAWIPELNAPLLETIDIDHCKNLLGFPSPAHPFNNLHVLKLRSCCNLQSFPNEIRFPSLVFLDLSWCTNLARISDILDAPLLERINLDYCENLLDFPRPAQHFNKLRNINLQGCRSLLYFPAPSPHCNNLYNTHFPSLNYLYFLDCIKLKVFPCISGNIEKLYMRKTAIHEVPSSVENLTELVELDLANCTSLKHISSNIHKLKALRKLNLGDCSALECFPEISHTMGSLEILVLYGTAIKGLHYSIANLSGLKKLFLSRCKNLDEVSPSIEKLTELLMLDLKHCTSLKHISFNICKLKALRTLNLEDCSALECFPEISHTMGSLEILDLHGTAIKGLHCSIENLSGLKKLFLGECKNLGEVSPSIEKLTELLELDLSECTSLKHISINICKLKALRKLNLRNCSALECFLEISDTMESLEFLDLTGTAIKGLHHSIEKLSGLKELLLRECKNLDEVSSSIENLTKLVWLNLTGCISLKHISFNISKMKALRRLYLNHCSALVCFPEISDTTESLETLALTGTAIKGLHHSIDKLTSVKFLRLSGCINLEMLPISIYNLTSLVQLDLSCCPKLENLLGNSLTDLSNYGESATTKPPICKLSNCELRFANCPNFSKAAVNIMELQINQHRDMTIKGCGTQEFYLKLCYPESEVPGWFKRQTNGSSINIQMLGHDGVNGHLIGLAACAVIEFYDADEGNDDGRYVSLFTSHYSHSCHCEYKSRLLRSLRTSNCSSFMLDQDANSDHVVLWYSNAFVSELCGKCTDYLFKFSIREKKSNCRVKHCGVCPIYEKHNIILPSIANWTCGAIDQDFGETSFKEQGKVRKFSDEAETSGRSNEDVIEPHPKRNCS